MNDTDFFENFDDNQIVANMAEFVNEYTSFIVPSMSYDIRNDSRLLIPFKRGDKYGFVDKTCSVVLKPQFDAIRGDIYDENDIVEVGELYTVNYPRANNNVRTYIYTHWGVIDSKGELIVPIEYRDIRVSDDKRYITINKNHVVDREGNIVIPTKEFDWIDGFTFGYARVQKDQKWGIVDTTGNVVCPIEYDQVWNFYNKTDLQYTTLEKKGSPNDRFYFFGQEKNDEVVFVEEDDYREERHYREFSGTYAQDVAGFSDEVINDAFDGDPDAYWNID